MAFIPVSWHVRWSPFPTLSPNPSPPQAQDAMALFLAPHFPVPAPVAALDGRTICSVGLLVGGTGLRAPHAVRLAPLMPGCLLLTAPQVGGWVPELRLAHRFCVPKYALQSL